MKRTKVVAVMSSCLILVGLWQGCAKKATCKTMQQYDEWAVAEAKRLLTSDDAMEMKKFEKNYNSVKLFLMTNGISVVDLSAAGLIVKERIPEGESAPMELTVAQDGTLTCTPPTMDSKKALTVWATLIPALRLQLAITKMKETLSQAVNNGRKLFVACIMANTEREAAGLQSVFPHLTKGDGLSDDATDIAGIRFENSPCYFAKLFDADHISTDEWSPYINGVDPAVLSLSENISTNSSNVDWMIVAGLDADQIPDCYPLLISSNISPEFFTQDAGEKDFSKMNEVIPIGSAAGRNGDAWWWDHFVIVVRKGGSATRISKSMISLATLFDRREFTLPVNVKCLDVK